MDFSDFFKKQKELMDVIEKRTGIRTSISTSLLALFTEVSEYANEEGTFKTWKLNHNKDREKEIEEFIDIFFFWLQIAILKKYDVKLLEEAYHKKWQKNIDRQLKKNY